MADATTTTYAFTKPEVGASEGSWGGKLNGNWDDVDDLLDGTTPVTGIDINSGTIDGTPIGAASASTGAFTTLSASGNVTFGGTGSFAGAMTGTIITLTANNPSISFNDTDSSNTAAVTLQNTAIRFDIDAPAVVGSSIYRFAVDNVVQVSILDNGNVSIAGDVVATSATLSGDVAAATATISGAATAASLTTTGAIEAGSLGAALQALVDARVAAGSPVKAWANFDGTGVGPSLTERAGLNIGSITKNGTGDYTITFDTALADANYAVMAMGDNSGGEYGQFNVVSQTASAVRIRNGVFNGYLPTDRPIISVTVVR